MESNPILNSPYLGPKLHYSTSEDGSLDYEKPIKGRRVFSPTGWLPAVNSAKDKFGYDEWHFLEVKEDIRDIKNNLIDKIESM